jgi:NADPH-dependent glutamate synthase beta subunit-like oxidoreductase
MEQLTAWVFTELEAKDSLFGIPRTAFFEPARSHRFRTEKYGCPLETPFGVAAGPHSQMAQNIVVAWACGARFIELKTIQTLDELEIPKPCIDLEDEGYNVEWSQELKVHQSLDEYLRAWVLIHALHHKLGFPDRKPGVIFNMSVGYDMQGILQPNVQWYLDTMGDCSAYLDTYVEVVARWHPPIRDLEIPHRISDTVTLSTMHGCPPNEIEQISTYLLAERGLHTSVKCNPTLLGSAEVRRIINDELGYIDIVVPDAAFEHDLKYEDAIPMLGRLREQASRLGLVFGVKLSNTLEVENTRAVFDSDEMMYMSGRALHAVTTKLALALAEELHGELLISFAGGADCFNVADLLASGMASVTVCSDLLKSGGYMRMLQYFDTLTEAMDRVGAEDLPDFICKWALAGDDIAATATALERELGADAALGLDVIERSRLAARVISPENAESPLRTARSWASKHGLDEDQEDIVARRVLAALARLSLRRYAAAVRTDWRFRKASFRTDRSKTARRLELFDCIEAPCVDECPVNQKVPQYMGAVRDGDLDRAVRLAREDNPLPTILGRVCDHLCENTCIRTHYDEPLAIREIKRFIMEHERSPQLVELQKPTGTRVAIIGAGPAGLSAAQKLASAGIEVTVFEKYPYAGGMVGGAIPSYRLPQQQIDQDLAVLEQLGVEIRYNVEAGIDVTLDDLHHDGYAFVFVAVGAQLAKRLGLPGEDAVGVMDALVFLRSVREGNPVAVGRRVGVVGAGDTAMDCVRSAYRLGSGVSLIYRRTIDQMPADREEIKGAIEEGARIIELAKPRALEIEGGRLRGLVCTRLEYRGDRDPGGRKIPHEIPGTEFTVPLDTLILAISQHAILDFFGDRMPDLTDRGYLRVDPETLETSIPGVFAGGDAADDGPSSIVKASADGKRAAEAIIARSGTSSHPSPEDATADVDLHELLRRRARRQWRVPVRHTPLSERSGFDETVLTYTPQEAMAEASRCLDCHQICSLCVGVCPNLALMTWESEPPRFALPALELVDGKIRTGADSSAFRADQRHQIAVLTDFCNECGNCVTFCPTSGEPYRDKPRLYLDRREFEAQKENAFMLFESGGDVQAIEARWRGETHRLEMKAGDGTPIELLYSCPAFSARLDPSDFSLIEATPGNGTTRETTLSLEACVSMYVILQGLTVSMPHLPRAPGPQPPDGTFVSHPEYPERGEARPPIAD